MENLNKFGVIELNTYEMKHIEGGSLFALFLAGVISGLFIGLIIEIGTNL